MRRRQSVPDLHLKNSVNLPPSTSLETLRLRPLLIALVIVLPGALLAPHSLSAAEVVPWLYEVAVPVENQSEQERNRASGEGLLKLLTRLTGVTYVPRTPEVTEALNRADGYYNEFRFSRVERSTEETDRSSAGRSASGTQLEFVIQFDPDPVQALIRSAGLPIWRAQREQVMVWAVLADESGRQIVGAASDLPLVDGLNQRARDRGVPLTLPLLDLEDQLAVDPAAVWGRLSQVVDPASRRYGADVLLLGRISSDAAGGWMSDWEFWVDGEVVPFTAESTDLMVHGIDAVDVLADELAARRVVHGRQAGQVQLAVSGVRTPADYGALLGYLKSLEFVQNVGVTGMRDGRIWLLVDTPAEPDRLLTTFERDRQLFNDQLALIDHADLRLVWRGGD